MRNLPGPQKDIELLRGIGRLIISLKCPRYSHNYHDQLKGLDSIDSFLSRKSEGINKGGKDIYYHVNIFKIAKGGIVQNTKVDEV